MTTTSSITRIGAGVLGLSALAAIFQNLVGNADGENGGLPEFLVILGVAAALIAWLFLRWIPRSIEQGPERAARRGAIISGFGLLTVAAFWTALPFVLGGTGLTLGLLARERGARGAATAAIVVGALAMLACIGVTVLDEVESPS